MNQMSFMTEGQFIGQNNVELEELVLGAIINYPEKYYELSDQLSDQDFTAMQNIYIYKALKEVSKESKIDIATVTDMIVQKKYHELFKQRGFDILTYINDMCERIDTDMHLEAHIKILNGYAKRRATVILGKNVIEKSNEMEDPDDILSYISSELLTIQEMGEVEDFNSLKAIDTLMNSFHSREKPELFTSGIESLDEFIEGFEKGELIIVAGAPSMGKTACALAMFKNSIFENYNPIYYSLEMSDQALMKRLFSSECDIELRKMRSNEFSKEDVDCLEEFSVELKEKKFWIDYKSRRLNKICSSIKKNVIRNKSKIIFIDYLQLIISGGSKQSTREQEVAKISRALKELAADLDIPIIALSQISRAVNARENKRPGLSDLRESGAIEQDADMVCFVYRPAYYNLDNAPIPPLEDAEIIIAKGRNTGVGTVDVQFVSRFTKYISKTLTNEERLKYTYPQDNFIKDEDRASFDQNRNQELFQTSPYSTGR
jgi:replicative DNA helicase